MESPVTESSPLSLPSSPSRQRSEKPDIEFLEELAKKGFWDIEYELNMFAKTQGYKYQLNVVTHYGLPKKARSHFKLYCSHFLNGNGNGKGNNLNSSSSSSSRKTCKHVLSFKYIGQCSGEYDPLDGPFELDYEEKSPINQNHNHPPSKCYTLGQVPSKEERISNHDKRMNKMTISMNKSIAQIPAHRPTPTATLTPTQVSYPEGVGSTDDAQSSHNNHHQNENNQGDASGHAHNYLYDDQYPAQLVRTSSEQDTVQVHKGISFASKRNTQQSNHLIGQEVLHIGSPMGYTRHQGDDASDDQRPNDLQEEGSKDEDIPWTFNLDKLNSHFERFQRKIKQSEIENLELKRKLRVLEARLGDEDNLQLIKDERDTYKRKYEELKAITKEQHRLLENDRKRRQDFERSEKDSSDKKRKVDERWLALLED
ncbi:hypothetical protein V865_000458 [Kwoniella europaea PYCC6329]|uniref:Uncharacterized protein n=1 Tax=Kwoniella europaea PYCC6329 TaxID=1423913 RepID=A0AAX4K942_9TREE